MSGLHTRQQDLHHRGVRQRHDRRDLESTVGVVVDRTGGRHVLLLQSAAATLPTAPNTTRAMGRDSTAPTPPSTRTTVSSMSTDDTRPAPDRVSGRTTTASATGTALWFSTSISTAESSQTPPPVVDELARTPNTRCTTSPPGTRMAVSTPGAPSRGR